MSRRQPIPGVDEAALAGLAEQFPSGMLRTPDRLTRGKTPAPQDKARLPQDNAPPARDTKEVESVGSALAAAPDMSPRKAPGSGLAVCAMMLALLAVLIAVSAVMPPPARLWLTRTLGDTGIVNLVTGSRADIDKRLAAAAQSIDALAVKETEIDGRVGAIETVVGSGAAMRRLDAVEAGLRSTDQRLAAAGDAERLAAARVEALDARLTTFGGDLKRVQDKLAQAERDVGDIVTARLGAVEANVGELQKIDRRPEKFFLAALQLRDMSRTANPFAREVAAAQALAGPNAELLAALKVLAADADHGVPTIAELRRDFTTLLAPRLAAVAAANRQSIAVQAWGWVKSQFATASAGAAGDRNAAVIALAALSLDQGQLEAAVHQLLLLEDEAALVAAEWLQNAGSRLATDKAIATVMSQAVDQLETPN
jgi:hypothetical protein